VRRRAGARDRRGPLPPLRGLRAPPRARSRARAGHVPLAHGALRVRRHDPRDRSADGRRAEAFRATRAPFLLYPEAP
jgi:hypothetical protein